MTSTETTHPVGAPPLPVTLRAIAAWLESHPEVEPYAINFSGLRYGSPARVDVYPLGVDRLAEIVRSIGGRWDKHVDDLQFHARQEIAPDAVVELTVSREEACHRVVTGTTTIEEPDPEALAAVPKVTREVETFEWRCDPILSATESA